MIVAADIEVDLDKFAGKPMYRTSTGLALKKTAQELDKALAEAEVFQPQQRSGAAPTAKKKRATARIVPADRRVSCCRWWWQAVVASRCRSCSASASRSKGTLAAALMRIGGGSAFADGAGVGRFHRFLHRGSSGA